MKLRLTESELKKVIIKMVNEALKPSQFRKYAKEFNRERYSDIFKTLGDKYGHDRNYYRIYIPLQSSSQEGPVSETQKEVTKFLEDNGYKVLDYVKGTAKYGDSKNVTTIGKALSRLKSDALMKKFVSDESRKSLTSDASNLMVVISRHPYDIAGSDTDRNWTNCMTMGHSDSLRIKELENSLREAKMKYETYKAEAESGPKEVASAFFFPEREVIPYEKQEKIRQLYKKIIEIEKEINDRKEEGQNVNYLLNDVKEGSLISYLIKNNDKNIQNPLSVLNIKPYENEEDYDDIILISDNKMYGQGRPEFKSTVDLILNQINGDIKGSYYCLNEKIYSDSQDKRIKIK